MNRRRGWIALLIALALVIPAPLALVSAAPPIIVHFPATGHNLGGAFLTYWRAHGALPTFGYPLTEEFTEVSAEDGQPYTVQYFERARLEHHPENDAPWDVLLGHLGRTLSAPLVDTPAFAPLQAENAPPGDERAHFPETGHTLGHGFLAYWQRSGELPRFGYPLSEEFVEVSPTDGRPYTVQYFERARFEYHPENADPQYQVLLGQFGRTVHGVDLPATQQAGALYFTETGHNLSGRFREYWEANGGLAVFGFPLSEEFMETLDGASYRVQYFERARFEYHVENQPPYDVLLGQFGREVLDR